MTRRELLAAPAFAWRKALPGYRYEFPRDHFAHPDFRTEWWYYTGNVAAENRAFGFELTFFRQGIERPKERPSAWTIDDVYLAHLALSDIGGQQFFHHQRLNRGGPGLAGISLADRRIWNGNWSCVFEGQQHRLRAVGDRFSFDLALDPAKPFVIHGKNGVSQKSPGEGRASHYISFTRLRGKGTIQLDGASYPVAGTAWRDHEFFTNQLAEDQSGWDWFSIQLENGCDLMLYQIRRKDGTAEPLSHGTFVDPSGRARELTSSDFQLQPGRRWKSPEDGTVYPIEWQVRVPALGISLATTTPLERQQLVSGNRFSPSYWEGSIRVNGSPASGVGYLEMTGYDKPVAL